MTPSGAAAKLHSRVTSAQAYRDQDVELRLVEQLNNMRHEAKIKDQQIADLKLALRKTSAQISKNERDLLRNRPEREAQTLDSFLQALRGKVASLEAALEQKEEEMESLKQNAKAVKVAELTVQSKAYQSEVYRLQQVVAAMKEDTKTGNEGVALREAQATIKILDEQIVALQDKNKQMRETMRVNESEAARAIALYESGKKEVESARATLEELKQAPLEIVKLRAELENVKANERRALDDNRRMQETHQKQLDAAVREAREQTVQRDDLTRVEREKDQLLRRVKEMEAQLETQQTDVVRRQRQIDDEISKIAASRIKDMEQLAADREKTLQSDVEERQKRITELEHQLAIEQEQHKAELEAFKQKEQERHKHALATISKHTEELQKAQITALEQRDTQFARERETFEAEKLRWEQERKQYSEQVKMQRASFPMEQQQQQQQPTPNTPAGTVHAVSLQPPNPPPVAHPADARPVPVSDARPKPEDSRSVRQQAGRPTPVSATTTQSEPQHKTETESTGSAPSSRPGPSRLEEAMTPTKAPKRSEEPLPKKAPLPQDRYPYGVKNDDTVSEVTVRRQDDTDGRSSHNSLMMDEVMRTSEGEIREEDVNNVDSGSKPVQAAPPLPLPPSKAAPSERSERKATEDIPAPLVQHSAAAPVQHSAEPGQPQQPKVEQATAPKLEAAPLPQPPRPQADTAPSNGLGTPRERNRPTPLNDPNSPSGSEDDSPTPLKKTAAVPQQPPPASVHSAEAKENVGNTAPPSMDNTKAADRVAPVAHNAQLQRELSDDTAVVVDDEDLEDDDDDDEDDDDIGEDPLVQSNTKKPPPEQPVARKLEVDDGKHEEKGPASKIVAPSRDVTRPSPPVAAAATASTVPQPQPLIPQRAAADKRPVGSDSEFKIDEDDEDDDDDDESQ